MALKRELLTTNEVAELLGISPFTIRRYIQLRKLKAVKLEGSYRVRRADLKQFLKAREIETEEELAALETDSDEEQDASPRRVTPPIKTARPSRKPSPPSKRASTRVPGRAGRSKPSKRETERSNDAH